MKVKSPAKAPTLLKACYFLLALNRNQFRQSKEKQKKNTVKYGNSLEQKKHQTWCR